MNEKKWIGFVLIGLLLMSMVGCGSKTDKDFLDALEKSVLARQEVEKKDNASKEEMVNSELGILDEFREKEFKDAKLKKLCQKYLDGLEKEKESFDLEHSEAQIAWQEGLVARYEVLNTVYDKYYQFDNVDNFNATFIQPLDKEKMRLKALKAFEADLVSQLDNVEFEDSGSNTMTTNYKNNTSYDFNIKFYI